jgi:hypothetical protein
MIGSELPITASGERLISTGHRPEKETLGCAYELGAIQTEQKQLDQFQPAVTCSGQNGGSGYQFAWAFRVNTLAIISWKIKGLL